MAECRKCGAEGTHHCSMPGCPLPPLKDNEAQPDTTRPKPSDDELRELWLRAIRLSRPWRGHLAHRLAYGIADDLEARGVTDEDIDRVTA